ncbi:hypothetical protein [uncultured Polaribacter sp.]|uniref:hypothetical protein n=1 Tax=uncultured Polaribacter sp. TaxID=174711 RepID=UPI00262CDBC8|nr:hypothetical protein [uncultured Polaribacter sp.]
MYFLRYIVLFFLAIQNFGLYAQIHCASVELILDEEDNNEFTFDDFSTYSSGYARTTVARLKVKVEDKIPSDGFCSWSLIMNVDNNGAPLEEWEELTKYGLGLGNNPLLSIFEVKITNDCLTSPNYDNFVPLDNSAHNIMKIIEDIMLNATPETSDIVPAGSCLDNVNGPGDYISNYNEFTFKIEVRINPGMIYNPGKYALNLNFRLEENI